MYILIMYDTHYARMSSQGMQLNSSRLRLRHLCKDNEAMFDVETQVEDLQIQLIEGVEDEYTTVSSPISHVALMYLCSPD
jgi:hypothetical protein